MSSGTGVSGFGGNNLDEAANSFQNISRVASAQDTAQIHAPLEHILTALTAQLVPAFGKEITDKTEMIGQQIAVNLW
jgi:hypothetical protein